MADPKQFFIADEFSGAVFVHGSTDPGTGNSLVLTAGDPIPPEALDELRANGRVPVTGVKSRKVRDIEADAAYAAERAAEASAVPGAYNGPSGSAEAGFDPARYSVEEVKAYLQEHPEQASSVLALEQGGKNRAGLVG